MESLEDRRMLATFTVNDLSDVGPNSLRAAIEAANANTENDVINITATGTINIASQLPTINSNTGNPNNNRNLTINGPGAALLTISASGGTGYHIFDIEDPTDGISPALVQIVGMTLTGGDTALDGGAIRSEAMLVVTDTTIVENSATFQGGAIFVQVAGGGTTSREVLRIENSIIDDNFANDGGGVAIVSGSIGSPTSDTFYI